MMVNTIKKMFSRSFEKKYFETYWAFDVHGTIFMPTYDLNKKEEEFYPYAEETLKLISNRKDIIMILWTCSYPKEIQKYLDIFSEKDIHFQHVNKNPVISSNMGNFGYYEEKFYFNVLFEDKAGFDPTSEWEEIYKYLLWCDKNNYLPNPNWTTKF